MTALASAPPRPWPAPALAGAVGLTAGVAIVAAIGLLAGTGRFAGESAQSQALKVLRADQADLVATTRRLDDAGRVSDLQTVGQRAQRTVERLRARDTALALMDDSSVRGTAERAHHATIQLLTGIGALANVDASHLDAWDSGERQAVSALGELDAVAALVAAMDQASPLRVDTRPVEASAEHASTYLTASAARLAHYERRMVSFRRKNRKKLQAAANYRASVNGQLAAYHATRKDLQRYVDDSKDFGELIVAFRETLQDLRTKRQSIRGTLASMSPPPALAGEHQALIGVLDKGIAGTEAGINLADAIQVLRDQGDSATNGFDLPEYDRFSQVSAEISRELAAATANWTAAMKTYVSRLKHPKGAPHRPRI